MDLVWLERHQTEAFTDGNCRKLSFANTGPIYCILICMVLIAQTKLAVPWFQFNKTCLLSLYIAI